MNEKIWEQLDLTQVNEMVAGLTETKHYTFSDIAQELATGNFSGAISRILNMLTDVCLPGLRVGKSVFAAILLLGLISVLLQHTFGVVKNKQVSELAKYFIYLLLVLLLMRTFKTLMETGSQVLSVGKEYMAALVPAFCLSISLSGGTVSAVVHYEFVMLLLYGIDYILAGLLLPVTESYVFLVIMDGVDEKHRMKEFVRLLEKVISWAVRICLTVTVTISGMQTAIAGQLDGVNKTVFQKAVSVIPGIGDLSESVTDVLLGTAGLIRNSIGVAAVVCFFLLIFRPVWELLCLSVTLKLAAACVRMLGQNSFSDTISKIGDSGILVMRIVTCAAISFCISVSMTMFVIKGGG